MNTGIADIEGKQTFYRLVSLWAICEAFAGGLMHGANIPLTGLVVSSMAVTCIILIAYHCPKQFSIIRATMIVCIAKLALSPHSPPTAYIAVLFQGLAGQLLLSGKSQFTYRAALLGILALVESAIQRILVLLIVFGTEFWKAVNQYIQKLTGEREYSDYSLKLAVGYIILHAIVGLLAGLAASGIAKRSIHWKTAHPEWILPPIPPVTLPASKKKKGPGTWKLILMLIWIILLAAWLWPLDGFLPKTEAFGILLRSVLIVSGWWLFISPWLMSLFKNRMKKAETSYQSDLTIVMKMIPSTQHVFARCWEKAKRESPAAPMRMFTKLLMVNLL